MHYAHFENKKINRKGSLMFCVCFSGGAKFPLAKRIIP
jgi:hypothetical protein